MTALRLQLMEFDDCETTLEKAYFDWGRGWPEDSPEPAWDEATPQERRTITLRGYNLYDGVPVPADDVVTILDTYVSMGINSRVTAMDTVRFVIRADRASELLAGIPHDAELESATDAQIAAVASLIELYSEARLVSWGKATKVLHKKRPALVPIIDSVAFDFLWKSFPHVLTGDPPVTNVLRLCRDLVGARSGQLRQIQENVAGQGFSLSRARILDFLIWIRWYREVDQFGVGPPFRKVWGVDVPEARALARAMWAAQS